MMISDESVFLSLAIGVGLGFFLVVNKVIVARNRGKGLLVFVSDFTFAAISIVITFMAAIPINKGKIRFLQVALELIGMMSFYMAFGDGAVLLSNFICKLSRRLRLFFEKKRKQIGEKIKRRRAKKKTAEKAQKGKKRQKARRNDNPIPYRRKKQKIKQKIS